MEIAPHYPLVDSITIGNDYEHSTGGGVDIPWLSVDPIEGTASADTVFNVAVKFDATGLALGEYIGSLRVRTGDPNNPTATVTVKHQVVESQLYYMPVMLKN
jgi:hypothetical protein